VGEVREARADDGAPARSRTRRTIRCIVRRSAAGYRAECIDVPVVALGGTLDETVAHLREAIAGRLEAEDPVNLAITFEEPLATRPSISTLARRIIARNRHGETDWGKRMGRESW